MFQRDWVPQLPRLYVVSIYNQVAKVRFSSVNLAKSIQIQKLQLQLAHCFSGAPATMLTTCAATGTATTDSAWHRDIAERGRTMDELEVGSVSANDVPERL